MKTINVSAEKWYNYWTQVAYVHGECYRGSIAMYKMLEEDYSIIRWRVGHYDENNVTITYTDEKLITKFILQYA
jgi:hypothetical protein